MATDAELMATLKKLDALAAQGDQDAAADAAKLGKIITSRRALAPRPDALKDVAQSIPAGVKQGVEGTIGGSENLGGMAGRGAGKVMKWLGASPEEIAAAEGATGHMVSSALNPMGGAAKMLKHAGGPDLTSYFAPTIEETKAGLESAVPQTKALNYESQTMPGQFAKTGSEFLTGAAFGKPNPRALLTRGAEQFGSGLASEAAGQATEGSAFEPWARFGAGAGTSAALSSSLLRRGPPSPEAQAQMDKGNVITAGQATQAPMVQSFESMLGGSTHQKMMTKQGEHFTSQAMQELGAPAGSTAVPQNMKRELNRIQSDFDMIEPQVGRVPFAPQGQQEIMDAVSVYNGNVGPNNRAPIVQDTLSDIGALMRQNNGPVLTGPQLMEIRTKLRSAQASADGQTLEAIRKIQNVLDQNTDVHLSNTNPELGAKWAQARKQYRLYLDLEAGIANSSAGDAALGVISPAQLRGGVRGVEGNRRLVTGESEFTDLANEGAVAMPRVGSSQSAERGRALVAGGALSAGDPMTAAAVTAGPNILGKVLMSRPVQQTLMSEGDNPRAALTAIIAYQNAMRDKKRNRGER